jgi:hypothetical protein
MRPHPKRARTSTRSPRCWGTDDRSGFIGNLEDFQWQYEWAGTKLINQHILCHPRYIDKPQEQLRTIKIPRDPDPIINARPEPYSVDEGLMPMTTDPAYPGDSGEVIRDENGNYIGVEPAYSGPAPVENEFSFDESLLDGPDVLG